MCCSALAEVLFVVESCGKLQVGLLKLEVNKDVEKKAWIGFEGGLEAGLSS